MISDLRLHQVMGRAARFARCRRVVLLLGLVAVALVASCDKVPLFAPSGTTIRLSTNAQVLPINGTAEITASVLESGGNPVQNGTVVSFTTSLGTVTPSEIGTSNSKATVTFHAGSQSGTAVINASSGSSSTNSTASTGTGGTTTTSGSGVSIIIGAAAASTVVVTASPSSVSQLGGTAVITASVLDASNNGLSGVPVSFSTDQGILSPVIATTDASGLAQTSLSTNQTATVTATAGAKTGTAKVTAVAVPTISISGPTDPSALIRSTFTLTATAGSGSSPITNVTVNFGDGSTASLLQVSGSATFQHIYRDAGTYTVTATATDASGQKASTSIPVVVSAAQPFNLTVTAPTGKSGVAMTLSVAPVQGSGAPAIISYQWNFGDGSTATTTVGAAPHTYTLPPGTTVAQQFIVVVTAIGADGRTGIGSTFVTITP